MNKILIFLISCSLLGIASSGSIFYNQAHRLYEQDLPANRMTTLGQMTQQELLRQKFVLDMLFHIQDRLQNVEELLREYGIMEIVAIRPEMCLREMDEQMQYMMDLCNKCMQTDDYSLSYTEEMRQIMGLYRLFVTARDFETFQQMSFLARKCIMGKIFALAFVSAIRDRQDTQMLIVPHMYEIMPEAYFTEEDMVEIQQYQAEHVFHPMNMPTGPRGYFDKSYLWMPYREMHRQIMLQKMRGKMGYVPMPVNLESDRNIVLLENKMHNKDSMQLFMEDLDLKAHVDSMIGQMMRLMEQDGERKTDQEMRMQDYMEQDRERKTDQEMRMRMRMQDYMEQDGERKTDQEMRMRMQMQNYMEQDGERKTDQEKRMRMLMQMQDYMPENNVRRQGMGVSDSTSHMYKTRNMDYAHNFYNSDMEYQRGMNKNKMSMYGNDELPMRNINDERLLHVGRRHRDYSVNQAYNWPYYMMSHRSGISGAHSVVDSADPRGLEALDAQNDYDSSYEYMQHPYSYYLEQQYNKMRSQIKTGTPYNTKSMHGMRYRRSNEPAGNEIYQSVHILLHNIRQLMTRIRMERMSMVESESMMGMSSAYEDLDRMRMIRLNKMRLDTRQARVMLEHFKEMEMVISMAIEQEMQNQKENEREMDIEMVMFNILKSRIHGKSIMQLLDDLQKEMMPQNNSPYATQMGDMKKRIHVAVMTHFLSRMDRLMQQYQQKYEKFYDVNDLMFPGVTVSQLQVDKLRTFVDHKDVDLVNMMHCKNMKSCLEEGKLMFARQPKLNHKPFDIKMQMVSERAQNVMMRVFLGRQEDADYMLMDTRVVKLEQGHNDIKFKSSDIMWTMKPATSYSQLYKYVMSGMQNPNQMSLMRKQNCHFPHHLLLPRGHVDGLHMKLIVVVSPMDYAYMSLEQDHMMCAMGIGNIGMDQQFYDILSSRYIKNSYDMDLLMKMPNVHAQDVLIYHE